METISLARNYPRRVSQGTVIELLFAALGTVRDYAAGEDWMNKKKDFLNMCSDLKE